MSQPFLERYLRYIRESKKIRSQLKFIIPVLVFMGGLIGGVQIADHLYPPTTKQVTHQHTEQSMEGTFVKLGSLLLFGSVSTVIMIRMWKRHFRELGMVCEECGKIWDQEKITHVLLQEQCPKCKSKIPLLPVSGPSS